MPTTYSHEDYCLKIKEKTGDFEVVTKYTISKDKIIIKHKICNRKFETIAGNFMMKVNCIPYLEDNKRRTHEEFVNEFTSKHGNNYKICGEYYNKDIILTVKHLKCGKSYTKKAVDFLRWESCVNCREDIKYKKQKRFGNKVKKLTNNTFEVIGVYVDNTTNIEIRHVTCDTEFSRIPNNFLNRPLCPNCNKPKSKGESRIEKYLIDNSLLFKKEFSFDDCINNIKLRFDFAIFFRYLSR